MTTELSHRRGTTFKLEFDLTDGWQDSHFTGGVVFTLRAEIPGSNVLDDDDAIAQVSVEEGGIQFTTPTHGVVTISASNTNTWPTKQLHWDIEARITVGAEVHDLGSGTCRVLGDITRGAG